MLLMDYPSIRGEYLPDYDKESTWDLLRAFIDANSQVLTDEFPGDRAQAISIFKSQCENMTFVDQIRYNGMIEGSQQSTIF